MLSLRKEMINKLLLGHLNLDEVVKSSNLPSFLEAKTSLNLIQSLVKIINPKYGFELDIFSDYPNNSGLGGSAAISAAVLGCLLKGDA